MELERASAGALPTCMLQPPRAPSAMSNEAAGTLLLSAAVQEMLMVQKSNKTAVKKPPPPMSRLLSGGGKSAGPGKGGAPAPERMAKAKASPSSARPRQPSAKRVARSILRRAATLPDEKKTKVLTCCCARLPSDMRCALHQVAPSRSWMRLPHSVAIGAGEVVVPRACGRGRWLYSEYARWRRGVWMPSRFYLELAPADARLPTCMPLPPPPPPQPRRISNNGMSGMPAPMLLPSAVAQRKKY